MALSREEKNARVRARHSLDREKINAYNRQWYRDHREQSLVRTKKWARENRDKRYVIETRHRKNNLKKFAEGQKSYYARNTEKCRTINRKCYLKSKYGITPEKYDSMLASQGGGCAICHRQNPSGYLLAVDHDHATGAIRGLLCAGCNTTLGKFCDSTELFYNAIDYLNFHNGLAVSAQKHISDALPSNLWPRN